MDYLSMGFIAIMAVGVVNIISFIAPNMDSKIKISIAFVVAFGLTFIPVDVQNVILEKIRIALSATTFGSGVYKLTQKAGGN